MVIRGGENLCPHEVEEFLHTHPDVVFERFPMTVTGRVRKVEMREAAVGILGLQGAAAVRNA